MIDIEAAADEIGISVDAYRRLCSLFLETMEKDTMQLREALETEQREEIRSRAHHIKGAAANLEFTVLSLKAEEMQHAADDGEMEQLRSMADSLFEEYNIIKAEFEETI
ncbi:MAG: Hpt domain-containing protein [Sediminispirochaetaceae bacterium]